jgi:adenylate cyclase
MQPAHRIRRLSAILFADVVGYSRMMAADEDGALAALNQHRADEFDPEVTAHNGRIVKLMGDGALVEFPSVVDAVNCALAIQIAAEGCTGIRLRIGVNLGEIITDLSKVSGLTVIARNSSFAYKGRSVDIRDVGRELGVAHVLEGSVRRSGQRVRVTAQMIDAATGAQLWADRYDGDLADVFGVQDAVTLQIVTALKVRLTAVERAAIDRAGTSDPQAHDACMRMRDLHFSTGLNKAIWVRAMHHGQRAVELDPAYAEASGHLSCLQWLDWYNGWSGHTFEEISERAEALARQSVAANSEEPWANIASAVAARWRRDLDVSLAYAAKALELSPDFGISLYLNAEVALLLGRPDQALDFMERAVRLDPGMSHMHLQLLGQAQFLLGRFETAALVFRERTLLAHETDIGRAWLAASLGHLGEAAEAQSVWADLTAIKPDFAMAPRLARFGYQRAQDPALVLEGVVKAGLPTGA